MTGPKRGGDRGGAPEAIGSILGRVMHGVSPRSRPRRSSLSATWARAAGPDLVEETHASTLRKGVLTVEVRSAGLLHELEGFRKTELLGRLLEEDVTGRVTGLRFRLGVF